MVVNYAQHGMVRSMLGDGAGSAREREEIQTSSTTPYLLPLISSLRMLLMRSENPGSRQGIPLATPRPVMHVLAANTAASVTKPANDGDGARGRGSTDASPPQVPPPPPPPSKGAIYFLLGGTSSMMGAACTHPLDTIKVRMQTLHSAKRGVRPPGVFRTAAHMVSKEGVLSLYQGLTASLGRQATYSTSRFAAYDYLKERAIREKGGGDLSTPERFAIGMTAGGIGGLVGTPMDVCNVRMQDDGRLPLQQRRNYAHALNALVRIYREEGIAQLYSGLGPNVVRAMLMSAGQLASYDTFKAALLTHTNGLFQDNVYTHFTASSLAGLVATLMTQPMDVIKTRLMASPPGTYRGALACAGATLREEGPLAFYKGTVAAFTRLAPLTILTFIFLEQLRRLHASLTGSQTTQ